MDKPEKRLSEHFMLEDFLKTSHKDLQEKNRQVTDGQVEKLTKLANLMEHVQFVLLAPITINSGYRCPELNKRVGSSDTSQHLLCEACDFTPHKMDVGEAFRILWKDMRDNGTNIGQLIFETAERNYGVVSWIHCALGQPYRKEENCGQILRAETGKDGKMVYRRIA